MLRHQRRHHSQAGQVPAQLKVQGVVVGVVDALVAASGAGGNEEPIPTRTLQGFGHFFNAVANAEVSAVHVPGE